MDQRLRKMEERLNGTELSDEQLRAMRKAEKEQRAQKKKERKELRKAASESLDVGHWTKEILNGSGKFASKSEKSIEEALSKESVGLVTYEDLKAKKEALEAAQADEERIAKEAKRSAEEEARKEREIKKAKVEKGKTKLSFNPDQDE